MEPTLREIKELVQGHRAWKTPHHLIPSQQTVGKKKKRERRKKLKNRPFLPYFRSVTLYYT